jgi:hypothetical protein
MVQVCLDNCSVRCLHYLCTQHTNRVTMLKLMTMIHKHKDVHPDMIIVVSNVFSIIQHMRRTRKLSMSDLGTSLHFWEHNRMGPLVDQMIDDLFPC